MNITFSDREIIGATLRAARANAKMTQAAAAGAVGITQSHLSLIERGKRCVSAETAAALMEHYNAEIELPLVSDEFHGESRAVRCVRMLQELAENSGSKTVSSSVEIYVCLCAYIMLKKLYLTNPHNSNRKFPSAGSDDGELFARLAEEPEKLARFIAISDDVKKSAIEPDEERLAEFLRIVNFCEEEKARILGSDSESEKA